MIGIVGGMGPHAGLDLVRKILNNTIAVEDQDHLPISLLSLPAQIPDRSAFVNGVSGAPNPGSAIAGIVDMLVAQGCSIVAMACNTAHAEPIYREMLAKLSTAGRERMVHLIEEVARSIGEQYPSYKKIGVLGTTATVNSKLYNPYLEAQGFEVICLKTASQRTLHEVAIRDANIGIKAQSNPVTEEAKSIVAGAISELAREGADAVLLACTELPLAASEGMIEGVRVIDPTNTFARAIIARYNEAKLTR